MHRRTALTLAAAALAAACAPEPFGNPLGREVRATITFAGIEVRTEGAGFESRRAAALAPDLSADLRTALERIFSDRLGRGGGARMVVEVDRLNVAGGTTTAFGRDQSRLSGAVRVLDGQDRLLATYAIVVTSGEAADTAVGAVVGAATGSGDRFYGRLLERFARAAREQVIGRDLPGERLVRRATGR